MSLVRAETARKRFKSTVRSLEVARSQRGFWTASQH
jgi:hypothetical protein